MTSISLRSVGFPRIAWGARNVTSTRMTPRLGARAGLAIMHAALLAVLAYNMVFNVPALR